MYSRSQRALAQCFGTAALVLVGPGAVIATLALAGKATPAVANPRLVEEPIIGAVSHEDEVSEDPRKVP
jgi:hypothetical protein